MNDSTIFQYTMGYIQRIVFLLLVFVDTVKADGLPTPAIIGIVVGCIVLIKLVVIITCLCAIRKKKRKAAAEAAAEAEAAAQIQTAPPTGQCFADSAQMPSGGQWHPPVFVNPLSQTGVINPVAYPGQNVALAPMPQTGVINPVAYPGQNVAPYPGQYMPPGQADLPPSYEDVANNPPNCHQKQCMTSHPGGPSTIEDVADITENPPPYSEQNPEESQTQIDPQSGITRFYANGTSAEGSLLSDPSNNNIPTNQVPESKTIASAPPYPPAE